MTQNHVPRHVEPEDGDLQMNRRELQAVSYLKEAFGPPKSERSLNLAVKSLALSARGIVHLPKELR